jgi:phage FluMu protein Com
LLRIGILLAYEKAIEVHFMPQAEVMLLRFGSSFKLVCPDCRKVLAKNVPSEHAAYAHGSAVVQHVAQCEGERNSWSRHLRSVFAARTKPTKAA